MKTAASNPSGTRGRRRVSVSLAESKTLKLFQEGRQLLAVADFEDVSIAQFANAAETSVGAFYVRFADKDSFLSFVTSHTFASARRAFDDAVPSIASSPKPAEALTDAIFSHWAGKEFAGVVRMAVKRGCSNIEYRKSFDAYREHVVDEVVGLIPDETKKEDLFKLELAIQSAFGVLTDAITSKPYGEPLKLSEYYETIVGLLDRSLGKMELTKREPKEPTEQSGVKKI